MRRALQVAAVVASLAALSLALPIEQWRTGELELPPLSYGPAAEAAPAEQRVWIDTDAACGQGAHTDPDDCLAIAALMRDPHLRIVGLSTVFGNAARPVVDATVAALMQREALAGGRPVPLHSGADAPLADEAAAPQVFGALVQALEQGPLTVVALGPLTNLAQVLEHRPDLRPRVIRLVAVMGRRPGHLFHPAEGAAARSWLGHGPVFRDFNVVQDPDAVAAIVEMQLPLVLLPYDAAREVEIDAADLDRLQERDGAMALAAGRARAWLAYWQHDIGRRGFYPFDLLAAAFVSRPGDFACASVEARFARDPLQYFPALMPKMLLVGPASPSAAPPAGSTRARYCKPSTPAFKQRLLDAATRSAGRTLGARARERPGHRGWYSFLGSPVAATAWGAPGGSTPIRPSEQPR